MPTISSSRRRPLMIAPTRWPGSMPRARANASLTSTSSGRPADGNRPRRRNRSFSVGACGTGMPIRRPLAGSVRSGDVERHVDDDPRVDARHARDLGRALPQAERRARQAGEHVREPVALVVGLLRQAQGLERAQVHDEHRHAGADHQADRDRLPLQAPEVAQQLAVERRDHQLSSDAMTLRSFRRSLAIRPSESDTTRSAIAATAALCVITAVVVPSSRFT